MKQVYFFGNGSASGNATMKAELGGKGANLAEMTNLGLRVPVGLPSTLNRVPIITNTMKPSILCCTDRLTRPWHRQNPPWVPNSGALQTHSL